MSDHESFQRFAAVTAIVSFPLAIASEVLSSIAQNFSPDTVANSVLCSLLGLAAQICSQITLHQASVRLTGATMSAKQPSYLFIEAVESHTQSFCIFALEFCVARW